MELARWLWRRTYPPFGKFLEINSLAVWKYDREVGERAKETFESVQSRNAVAEEQN